MQRSYTVLTSATSECSGRANSRARIPLPGLPTDLLYLQVSPNNATAVLENVGYGVLNVNAITEGFNIVGEAGNKLSDRHPIKKSGR